jgi:MerR family redox-sensitive transcriptional activator SoxR
MEDFLTIGELAARSGLATSALRYYEEAGLITAERTPGGQRRYQRSALRRVAFVQAAQRVGLELAEIRTTLAALPQERTPTKADWARLSRRWQPIVQERIDELIRLRDELDGCIGCGCLSLQRCRIANTADELAEQVGSVNLRATPPEPVRAGRRRRQGARSRTLPR